VSVPSVVSVRSSRFGCVGKLNDHPSDGFWARRCLRLAKKMAQFAFLSDCLAWETIWQDVSPIS
jgi:hypothetical protein